MTARARQRRGAERRRRTPTRRRLAPEDRRAELLDAALDVLRTIGPHEARVEDVTRVAGAAKGTFYLYFESWDDLIVAVRDHLLSTLAVATRGRLGADPVVTWAVLERECLNGVDFIVALGDLHEAIFHGPAVMDLDPSPDSPVALATELIEAGIAAASAGRWFPNRRRRWSSP